MLIHYTLGAKDEVSLENADFADCDSIIPVVSLKTFGIQKIRLMADTLISLVKEKQTGDAPDADCSFGIKFA